MKIFGEYLQEFLSTLKTRSIEPSKETQLEYIFNQWGKIIQEYPKEPTSSILKNVTVEAFEESTLTLKTQHSAEKFLLKAEEKNILKHINTHLEKALSDVVVIEKLTIIN